MQKIISQILLVSRNPARRRVTFETLSRAGADISIVENATQAAPFLRDNANEIGLVVMHLEYQNQGDPMTLYKAMRDAPDTQTIPMIILVETEMEKAMVRHLPLSRCCCFLAPLSYGALVFALPSLDIEIKDSILYQKLPALANTV